MASVTFSLPDDVKDTMNEFSWVNWSELARIEIKRKLEEEKSLESLRKIISKSKFTEKDAEELSKSIKLAMHKRLKSERLI
jgi:hypothetical protein